MSACNAPAVLIACRIVIRSLGPMPSAFKPFTRSWSVSLFNHAKFFVRFLINLNVGLFTVCVVPASANGPGCDTCGVSVTRIVGALGDRYRADRHVFSHHDGARLLINNNPRHLVWFNVRSCSMSVSSPTTLFSYPEGTESSIVPGSLGFAALVPRKHLQPGPCGVLL